MPIVPNKTTYIMGIDPGANGGLAILTMERIPKLVSLAKLTPNPVELMNLIEDSIEQFQGRIELAILEKVGGFVGGGTGAGGGNANASRMFKFGLVVGYVEMALIATEIPYETVIPVQWQRVVGITKKARGESRDKHKKKMADKARQLFPKMNRKITLDNCDAVLLAEYGRRKFLK